MPEEPSRAGQGLGWSGSAHLSSYGVSARPVNLVGTLREVLANPMQPMASALTFAERHFQALWTRWIQNPGTPLSTSIILGWAAGRGLEVLSVEEGQVGAFHTIPAIMLRTSIGSACFPTMGTSCPSWQRNRAYAEKKARLWEKVEWFSPLWIAHSNERELLRDIEASPPDRALGVFNYHASTLYPLGFQATCLAQLLPASKSISVFAPLAREAFLGFYSGSRASSVAALIPVIEGVLKRIYPGMKPKDAANKIVDGASALAAKLYFGEMWAPPEFKTTDFLYGLDERVFVFETFRNWLLKFYFCDINDYRGKTSLNRHIFAHGDSTEWGRSENFSRLVVAIAMLGVIESWHDGTNSIPVLFPSMNEDSRLLWQQALLRGQIQHVVQLTELEAYHASGRLVPEYPTDGGVTLRTAVLMEDAMKDLVKPLRDAGWSVAIGEPDERALYVLVKGVRDQESVSVALLYSCATSNDLYKALAEGNDVILYRGPPFHQASYAYGISKHVGPVLGWLPPCPGKERV